LPATLDDVALGADGLAAAAERPVVIDLSTVASGPPAGSPGRSERQGFGYLDAP